MIATCIWVEGCKLMKMLDGSLPLTESSLAKMFLMPMAELQISALQTSLRRVDKVQLWQRCSNVSVFKQKPIIYCDVGHFLWQFEVKLQGLYLRNGSMHWDPTYAKWKFRARSLNYCPVTLRQVVLSWCNLRHKESAWVQVCLSYSSGLFSVHFGQQLLYRNRKTGNKILMKLHKCTYCFHIPLMYVQWRFTILIKKTTTAISN